MHYNLTDDQIAYLKGIGVPAFSDRTVKARPVPKNRPVATPRSRAGPTHHRVHRDRGFAGGKRTHAVEEWARFAARAERAVGKLLTSRPARTIHVDVPVWLKRAGERIRRLLGLWIIAAALLVTNQFVDARDEAAAPEQGRDASAIAATVAPSNVMDVCGADDTSVRALDLEVRLKELECAGERLRSENVSLARQVKELRALVVAQKQRIVSPHASLDTNFVEIAIAHNSVQASLRALQDSTTNLVAISNAMLCRQEQLGRANDATTAWIWRTQRLLVIAGGAMIICLAGGFWRFENKLRRVERIVADEAKPRENHNQQGRSSLAAATAPRQAAVLPHERPQARPVGALLRAFPQTVPPPAELLQRIAAAAKRTAGRQCLPTASASPRWGIGVTSSKGPVRERNEDYALAFEINKHQVLLIADGVGGLPHGQQAAYHAVRAAAWHITMILSRSRPGSSVISPEVIAADALERAAQSLGRIARRPSYAHTTGLRTTLIVVVASRQWFGFCYIGDGGGCVLRAAGSVERFLVPQKADPEMPNVLAGSLGPALQGEPGKGALLRLPGDLLICGTDGVMDRLGDDYPIRLHHAAMQAQGDLQSVTDRLVEQMGSARDEYGYICDDNLTIALLGGDALCSCEHESEVKDAEACWLPASSGAWWRKLRGQFVGTGARLRDAVGALTGRLAARIVRPTASAPKGDYHS